MTSIFWSLLHVKLNRRGVHGQNHPLSSWPVHARIIDHVNLCSERVVHDLTLRLERALGHDQEFAKCNPNSPLIIKMLSIRKSSKHRGKCTPNALPCRINHNGRAEVSKRYWTPTKRNGG